MKTEMSTPVLINIAIEISCGVMCLAIMACILIGDSLRVRMNRAFISTSKTDNGFLSSQDNAAVFLT